MDALVKILPLIVILLLIFAAREGYSIFKYAKHCRLHEAAKAGNAEKVLVYIQAGHPVNAIDPRFGLAPLHYAVRNGHVEVARLLIDHGAALDAPSAHGITARQWTIEYLPPGDAEELARFAENHPVKPPEPEGNPEA